MKYYETPCIDCDIHPFATEDFPLAPFIPKNFRDAVAQGFGSQPGHGYQNPFGVNRRDVEAPNPKGWAKALFDEYDIVYGVLQVPGMSASLTHNVDVGNALARAWNDWQIENWLGADNRYLGSVCVSMNDPVAAVAEIHRAGQHPQMAQVTVCGESTMLYGNRFYHPIYEACAEHNLPFAIHPGSEGSRTPSTPIGAPASYFEWHSTIPVTTMSHTASFVCEGVFEKFPNFKVILVEGGFGWFPHLMWRLDKNFKALRATTPWLKRLPSEYILDHVRLTTQPMEEPRKAEHLLQMFDMMEAHRTLCFASDFPHWDFDDPRRVFPKRMDPLLRDRIFYSNAAELFGLPSLDEIRASRQVQELAEVAA